MSTQITEWPKSARHAPLTSPTYPVPMMPICIRVASRRKVKTRRLPQVRQRERRHAGRSRLRRVVEHGRHRPELKVAEEPPQAAFGVAEVPVVPEAAEQDRVEPRLVGIDLPRVEIKDHRAPLAAVDAADAPPCPAVRQQAEISAAGDRQVH